MHLVRVIAFHKVGCPATAPQELLQFLVFDAGQHGRVADLVAIEVQDRQHGSIGDRVEELVGMPCGRQGTGFRLAIANDTGNNQIRIVESGTKGMHWPTSELATFMN